MVIYGPGVRPVGRGHRSRDPGRAVPGLQPLGPGDARHLAVAGASTSGPVPLNDVSRAVEEIQYAYDHLGIRCFWARPDQFNHRNLGRPLLRPDLGAAPGPRLRVRDPRVTGAQRADRGSDRSRPSPSGTWSCTRMEAQHAVRVDDLQRRVRAVPRAALRLHGGGMRVAAVVAAPHRRAPRARRATTSSPSSRCRRPSTSGATAGSPPSARTGSWPT